jgi:hypothetical protein
MKPPISFKTPSVSIRPRIGLPKLVVISSMRGFWCKEVWNKAEPGSKRENFGFLSK